MRKDKITTSIYSAGNRLPKVETGLSTTCLCVPDSTLLTISAVSGAAFRDGVECDRETGIIGTESGGTAEVEYAAGLLTATGVVLLSCMVLKTGDARELFRDALLNSILGACSAWNSVRAFERPSSCTGRSLCQLHVNIAKKHR